ncbi:MAG: Hsp70 family protein [Phycisphaerae bacterium]|nr:Hsp70 family protein [Phycisphaerae bacterium]
MARLGVDFGTTNTVVMMHDRGMFSAVLHSSRTRAGTVVQEVFPSAILMHESSGQRWYGIEADRRFGQVGPGPGYVFVPSLKRRLHGYAEGRTDGESDGIAELLTGYLHALAESIRASQNFPASEPLEAVITWPANANGAQRHITRRCFRDAGFDVLDTLNEPTASAIELADCILAGRDAKEAPAPQAVAVFDLGGGTFDASVVWIDGDDFQVLASGGIEDLGGDDFDAMLLDMFLERLDIPVAGLGPLTHHALLRQTRSQKETIAGGVMKSLFLNPADFGLAGVPVSISVDAFNDRLRPRISPAIKTLGRVIKDATASEPRIGGAAGLTIYLVGGSSKLPLVAEMASEAFPKSRVVLTDKPFRSVALGAAICSTERVRYRDVFARHFGLIRLRDHGRAETFDTIFPAGTPIPRKGEPSLEKVAWYHPLHNVGHLRYLECTAVGEAGLPDGNVRAWSDILFPYDPAVPLTASLTQDGIEMTDRFSHDAVCEVYRCDADSVITVELHRPACHDVRTYEIFRD